MASFFSLSLPSAYVFFSLGIFSWICVYEQGPKDPCLPYWGPRQQEPSEGLYRVQCDRSVPLKRPSGSKIGNQLEGNKIKDGQQGIMLNYVSGLRIEKMLVWWVPQDSGWKKDRRPPRMASRQLSCGRG